jgi:hypothetical protein
VPLQKAMQRAAGELRDGLAKAAHDVVKRQKSASLEFDYPCLLDR